MMILTNILDKVIVAIAPSIVAVSNGYEVMGIHQYIVAETVGKTEFKLYSVDKIPADVGIATHCYDGKIFTVNPNYIKPPMSPQDMEQQLIVMQKAIDDLILNGGVV